jgi:sodium-dependent dicarboxylate transporter 2/3/5
MMPILAATGVAIGVDPALLMFPAVLAASGAFMLPVATAPNAIAFGTGLVPAPRMMREGFIIDILGVLAVSTVVYFAMR